MPKWRIDSREKLTKCNGNAQANVRVTHSLSFSLVFTTRKVPRQKKNTSKLRAKKNRCKWKQNTQTIPNKISELTMQKRATRTESNAIENVVCTCSERWCWQVFSLALLRPRVPEVHFLLGYVIIIKCGESKREKKRWKSGGVSKRSRTHTACARYNC